MQISVSSTSYQDRLEIDQKRLHNMGLNRNLTEKNGKWEDTIFTHWFLPINKSEISSSNKLFRKLFTRTYARTHK